MSLAINKVDQQKLNVNRHLGFDKKLKISVHLPTGLPLGDLMVEEVIRQLMLNYRYNRLKKFFLKLKQKFYPFGIKNKFITVLWISLFWLILAIYLNADSYSDLIAAGCIDHTYDYLSPIKTILISISLGGLLLGTGLVFLWEKWLRKLTYLRAITYIIIFYTTCYFTIHLIIGFVYYNDNPNAIVNNNLYKSIIDPFFDLRHLPKYLFWLFVMVLTMTFLLIRDKFGPKTFVKFLRGNYFHPKREERIFMFMDLKSSTTIAENLGEEQYFNFLYDTFRIATPGILATNGEIYQYVGDEIVISWSVKKGVLNANCIQCYYKVANLLKNEFDYFDKNYGVQPQFKAGLHFGSVIAGEMGIIKREIVYSGDVLNTASRIQSLCNEMNTEILISTELIKQIDVSLLGKINKSLGKINLRGKQEKIELATLIDSTT